MDHTANISENADTVDTIQALKALVIKHERRLEKNSDYKAIQALNRSIRDLLGEIDAVSASPAPKPNGKTPLSQSVAARQVILNKGEPVPSPVLLEGILALGAHVGGKNKQRNMGSMLSSNKGFKSVPWKGGVAWWVTDREVPRKEALI